MKLSQKARSRHNALALSFAIPCLGMLFVMLISKYEPFGNYSMLYSDMYHQYYPFFVAYREALLSGESMLYTWSVGLGMDYLGLISYYLASPLNLLSVLVPEGWLLEFFSLLVPVKLGFAGLTFAVFLKNLFGKDDISIAFFGGCYGLCAWALGFQWNVMWLDTFALLPLVVLGAISLLRDKKFALYTLTLFLAVYANYYVGFFVCVFIFLLFFVYEICRWKGWKVFFQDLCRIALFSALALAMTAIMTLPAFTALQTTYSSVNKFPKEFKLNIADENTWKGLLDAMRQVAGNMGGAIEPNFKEGLPNIYCGIGTVVLAVLYLLSSEVKLRDKLCAVGLLLFFNVSFIIRQLDYIWHGFHFTNMIPYRFSFLYSFVMLYMAYRAWTQRDKFNTAQLLTAGCLTAVLLACSNDLTATKEWELGSKELEVPVYLIYNSVFLLLYLAAWLSGRIGDGRPGDRVQEKYMQRQSNARFLVLSVMAVELVGTLVCFGLYFTGTSVKNYPKGLEEAESMINYMHEREEDNLFYRAETTHSQSLNDGALNGYYGVSTFTSSANVKTTEFMKALGYSAKNNYNRYVFEESSPVSNLFLGLKYMIERDGKDKASTYFTDVHHFGKVHLLENNAYLPLGFLAESQLLDVDFDYDGNPFDFQNELFSAATGMEQEVWSKLTGESLTITGNDVTITDSTTDGYCKYEDCKSGSNVVYSYTADRDGFMCIHLTLPKRNDFYVSVNGVERYKESISLAQMLAVGDVAAGDVIDIRIMCDSGEKSTMTLRAALLDEAQFFRGYARLAESTLELTTFQSTLVEGRIHCERDGLLYTSIPQNGNWYAEVDGQPVQISLVGDCMAAVELTAGTHTVTFRYKNTAFTAGALITAVSFAAFLLLVHRIYKPDWKRLLKGNKGKYQQ